MRGEVCLMNPSPVKSAVQKLLLRELRCQTQTTPMRPTTTTRTKTTR